MAAPSVKMDKNNVTQIILNLTLDTIYLLTGENYEVMKRTSGSGGVPSRVPGGPNRSWSLTTNPSPTKILELTNEVIHILTGEVWKYLGQTTFCDYTKREDSLSLQTNEDTTHDDPPNCGKKESNFQDTGMSIATGSTHHWSLKPDVSEEVLLPDSNISTTTLIKEEHMPAEEHLPNLEVSKPRQRTRLVNKFSHEDRHPRNREFNSPEDDAQFISFVIKEEEDEEDVQDPNLNTSTNHVRVTSPEKSDVSTMIEYLDKNLTPLENESSSNHEPPHQANFGEDQYSCYDPGAGVGLTTAGFSGTVEKPTDPQTNVGKHIMIIRKGKTYFCSECGKSSTWRSVLVLHQRIHTGEKPFSCLECGKCFNCKSHLILHQRTHTGEKPYSCSECGKRFSCSSHLSTHRRVHTGEKPYSCTECGKSFISNSNLIRHQKFHTGDRPYSCPDCGKCYRYNSDLARHQRRRPGSKPYSCSECGMCYFSKCALVVHLQTHGLGPPVL